MTNTPDRFSESDRRLLFRCLALAILVVAATVRIWGIQHDLPVTFFGDERGLIKQALRFGSGDLNPHRFIKPAFNQYILFVEYGVYFIAGRLFGWWTSVEEFAVAYVDDPAAFILIGRLTTLAFGLASVWCVYRIGEKHFGKHVGLVAALLLTFTYGHVTSSRHVKEDVASACFAIWSVCFLLGFVQDGRVRKVIISSILAGIGHATKYYTLPMLLPIGVAVLASRHTQAMPATTWRRRLATFCLALGAFAATFFICAPYNLLDPQGRHETLRPLRAAVRVARQVQGSGKTTTGPGRETNAEEEPQHGLAHNAMQYLQTLGSPSGMGIEIASICIIGLAGLVCSKTYAGLVFSLYPLVFGLASALAKGNIDPRHQMPVYVFLVVAGGTFVVGLANRLPRQAWIIYGTFLLLMIAPALRIVQSAIDLSRTDTRNIATGWIEQHIPAGAKLLVDEDGPPLRMTSSQLKSLISVADKSSFVSMYTAGFDTYLKYQLLAVKGKVAYELHEIRFPWWRERFEEYGHHVAISEYDSSFSNPLRPVGVDTYDNYVAQGYQYAVVHSGRYQRFFDVDQMADNFPTFARFYRELFARGTLLCEFSPQQGAWRGPVVRIYRLQ